MSRAIAASSSAPWLSTSSSANVIGISHVEPPRERRDGLDREGALGDLLACGEHVGELACPSPSATPSEVLRDCRLLAVSIRSPMPDKPVKVAALAPLARPRRIVSASPSVISVARAFSPSLRPAAMPLAMRDHVLHHPAEGGADHVVAEVNAEVRVRDLPRERSPDRPVRAGERHAAGQVGGDLARERGAGQHGDHRARAASRRAPRASARSCRARCPSSNSRPASRRRSERPHVAGDRAHMLRRHGHQDEILVLRRLAEVVRGADAGHEAARRSGRAD